MTPNPHDTIQAYMNQYDRLVKLEQVFGLEKHQYVALAMAAETLDNQKDIQTRLKALEDDYAELLQAQGELVQANIQANKRRRKEAEDMMKHGNQQNRHENQHDTNE